MKKDGSLFGVAGAVRGEMLVFIFRGSVTFRGRWIFGDNSVSLFVGGIPFGEMQVSFFVVSAALGKILNARLDAKFCIL